MSVYTKLHEIQKHVLGLGKDKKSFGYDYVTGSKVLEHIKPKMNELGLLLKQEVLDIVNTRIDYTAKSGAKSEMHTCIKMRFTWIDVETGETDVNLFVANGQNDWEKGLGSALTYGERYFLLKYFHIATDEDDIDNPERENNNKNPSPLLPLSDAINGIKNVKNRKELFNYWNMCPQYHEVESFKNAAAEMKTKYPKVEK